MRRRDFVTFVPRAAAVWPDISVRSNRPRPYKKIDAALVSSYGI